MLFLFPNCNQSLILTWPLSCLGHYLTSKLLLELELRRGSELQEDNTTGVFVYGLSATERSLCGKEDFTYRMGPGIEQIFARSKAKRERSLG